MVQTANHKKGKLNAEKLKFIFVKEYSEFKWSLFYLSALSGLGSKMRANLGTTRNKVGKHWQDTFSMQGTHTYTNKIQANHYI